MNMDELSEQEIGMQIVEATSLVYQELGPGLIKDVYTGVLEMELTERGISSKPSVPITIQHRGRTFPHAFKASMIVENKFILDISADEIPVHGGSRRLLTFLRYTGLQYGYVLNFGLQLHRERFTHIPRRIEDPILHRSRGIASARSRLQPGLSETRRSLKPSSAETVAQTNTNGHIPANGNGLNGHSGLNGANGSNGHFPKT